MPDIIMAKKKAALKRGPKKFNAACFSDLLADLPEPFEDAEEENPVTDNGDNMQSGIGRKQKNSCIAGIEQQADNESSFHAARCENSQHYKRANSNGIEH
jgi:hypothetical protein